MESGLSSDEASAKLKQFGYNELPSAKPRKLWHIALEIIKEPLFLLLITCATLYIIIGSHQEGFILLSTTLIIIFITFYQNQKTEKALEALSKLSSPRVLVIRDGKEVRIPGREVVPGDILLLHEGDRIAADATVIDSTNLSIDESLLTGESVPVFKTYHKDTKNPSGLVYSGTLIIQGKGLAKVLKTGAETQFGKIGTSIKNIEQSDTRLQREMKSLIRNLFIISAIICIGLVFLFYYTRGNILQSLLNGLAFAMAILPEEFPVVFTVFMALGAWKLSRKNVLTRKSSAIETLGATTVLCSDKTGTITQNKMQLSMVNAGGININHADFISNKPDIEELLNVSILASQSNPIDPMEKAIHEAYKSLNYYKPISSRKLIKEFSLSKDFFAMTRVIEDESGIVTAYCKGAPEVVLSMCQLNEADKTRYIAHIHSMAKSGCRVLGVAKSNMSNIQMPDHQKDIHFTFIGLLGLEDPIRPEVPQAIKECYEAGIKVVMITGDFPETARSIARQIGITEHAEIMTGKELHELSEEQLKKKIETISIFARVIPDQKLRIVKAFKSNNEVVAMTGDGVNDAPALKAADIGIAMGNKGTDVAREASSLVIVDDNFASIVSGIRSGRRIFDNLQKAISYIMAIHIPIIGLSLLPAFISSIPIILMPLHIVFMELIIDPVSSITFESEQEELGIMKRPPRNRDEQFFGFKKIMESFVGGTLLLIMVLIIYFMSVMEQHTEGEIRAIVFSALITGNVFLILSDLSKTRSIFRILAERNFKVLVIPFVALILLIVIISTPFFQDIFNFEFPGYYHFIPALAGSLCVLMILELYKYFRLRILNPLK